MRGPVNVSALQRALDRLVSRHKVLGSRFGTDDDGNPVQWLVPGHLLLGRLSVLDGSGNPPAGRASDAERRALDLAQAELARPMPVVRLDADGGAGPLVRATLIKVGPDDHILAIGYHHLLGDGASSRVLRRDLLEFYAMETGVGESFAKRLAGPAPDFGEVVAAETAPELVRRSAGDLEAAVSRLAGMPPMSTVPPSLPRPSVFNPDAHWVRLDLTEDLHERIDRFARDHRATAFIVYSLAAHLLVQRYCGQRETMLGFMTESRQRLRRDAVGLHAETLVQSLRCTEKTTVAEAVRQLRDDVLSAAAHGAARFEEVVERLGAARMIGAHPVFQAMVNFVDLGSELTVAGLRAEPIVVPVSSAWLDLEFRLHTRSNNRVEGYLRCPKSLYDEGLAATLATHFTGMLDSLVAQPGAEVDQITPLSPGEESAVLAAGCGPRREACARNLAELLREQFARTPDRTAVEFAGESLTYAQLSERAEALARALRSLGAGPDRIVAVAAERSVELVVAVIGIVLAGAAYVPIDPSQPSARRDLVYEDLKPVATLATHSVYHAWHGRVQRLRLISELADGTAAMPGPGSTVADPEPGHLAYVIYTSGSTGRPKCVGNTHEGIVNRLAWMQSYYPIDVSDAVLHKTPTTFDVSVWELYWPLVTGARLVVAEPNRHSDPEYLAQLICGQRITVCHFVPSMLRAFVHAGKLSRRLPLRRVICSGETLPPQLCDAFREQSDAMLHNLYGPTEAAIDVTAHTCGPLRSGEAVPIGHAVDNTRVHVLDRYRRALPFGAVGELYLGGVQLARGYLNQAGMTRERFVDDPASPGERLYRTGDLASMRPDGLVRYHGRSDRQVKVRGFRIELGEVEAAIQEVPEFGQAVAALVGEGADARLVAFYTGSGAHSEVVAAALAARLPDFMIPSRFHHVDRIPLLPSGKANVGALVADLGESPEGTRGSVGAQPSTAVESTLLDAVREVLDDPQIAVEDSFFAVGGDSIRSIHLVARAAAKGLRISIEDIFSHPTVRQLAGVAVGLSEPSRAEIPPFALLDQTERELLPAGVVDAFPLSAAMEGLLVESTRSKTYRIYTTSLRLRGVFDAERMATVARRVAFRHPVLRSRLDQSAPTARPLHAIFASIPDVLDVRDLRRLSRDSREEEFRSWLEGEQRRAFDWYQMPLWRLTVHLFTEAEYCLTLAEPFLDGYSAALVLSELLESYGQSLTAEPDESAESPEPIEMRAQAEFLSAQQDSEKRSAEFWGAYLDGLETVPLSGFEPQSRGEDFAIEYTEIIFPEEVPRGLAALNRASGFPVKSLLLAAHFRAVAELTGRSESVTALMENARPDTAAGSAAVGLFLNPIVLRLPLERGTWWDLARNVYAAEARTLPHRSYPYLSLLRNRLIEGVDTLFNYTRFHPYRKLGRDGAPKLLARTANDQTYFPLTAQFQQDPETSVLVLRLEFCGPSQPEWRKRLITDLYREAVSRMALAPYTAHDVGLSVPGPERTLEADWPEAAGARPVDWLFAERASFNPAAVAVRADDRDYTYAELDTLAARMCQELAAARVKPGEPVGVCLHRSIDLVAAMLGVWRVGGVYFPLDPALTATRRSQLVASSGGRVIISAADEDRAFGNGTTMLPPPTMLAAAGLSGVPGARQVRDPGGGLDPALQADQAAYLVYTSGSTGTPKGVLVSHRALYSRLAWAWRSMPWRPGDTVAARTPIGFVDSIAELLVGLLAGVPTVMVSEESGSDPARLIAQLRRSGATQVSMVPTLAQAVLRAHREANLPPGLPRRWILSGETLPVTVAHELLRRIPGAEVFNLYGATETAGDVTAYRVTGRERGGTVPIGAPIDGCRARVVDTWGNPLPRTVAGALMVSGVVIALGYHQDPGLTSERFRSAPDGTREYFTGDLAMVSESGVLVHLGRQDRQVKIRGVRLEPVEIEAALRCSQAVADALVTVADNGTDRTCVAYVLVPSGEPTPSGRELRDLVRERLSAAAIPAAFAMVEDWPLTATGKIDHRALASLARPLPGSGNDFAGTPPHTMIERELARLWRDRLGDVPIRRDSDFFELGGHSLHAILLASAITERTGAEVRVTDVFDRPTLRAQGELVEDLLTV
jgi:amino acid adenylation domain-containing protein